MPSLLGDKCSAGLPALRFLVRGYDGRASHQCRRQGRVPANEAEAGGGNGRRSRRGTFEDELREWHS